MFNFENLEAWKQARVYASSVYRLTKTFPREEVFGLTSQIRRAAVSVSSNSAEGASRHSRADYAHFVEIAAGSLFETVSLALIAQDQGYLAPAKLQALYAEAETLSRLVSGLRAWLLADPKSKKPPVS